MTKGTNKCIVEKVFFRKGGEKYFRMLCQSIDVVGEKYFVGSYVNRLKVWPEVAYEDIELICLPSDIELVKYISETWKSIDIELVMYNSETRKSIDMATFGYRVSDVYFRNPKVDWYVYFRISSWWCIFQKPENRLICLLSDIELVMSVDWHSNRKIFCRFICQSIERPAESIRWSRGDLSNPKVSDDMSVARKSDRTTNGYIF